MTFIFLQFIIFFMTSSQAQTHCVPAYESINLNLVHPKNSAFEHTVQVRYELADHHLNVWFDVQAPVLHKKEVYESGDYPFEFDVAEVFITTEDTRSSKFSYYEYEVTPLGQVYDLRLDVTNGKRVGVDIAPVITEAQFSDKNWSARFSIPLERIGWNEDASKLRGNFFTIIGKSPRTYWSAFLPQQDKANFHKPEFFRPLFNCK